MASSTQIDRLDAAPFLLKVFYRTGAFHRLDEFAASTSLPHLSLYTWSDCSLTELSHLIAAATPAVLPNPAIGTRLSFRLIFADTRGGPSQPVKFVTKELGSIVIGEGGSGLTLPDDADEVSEPTASENAPSSSSDGAKTLGDAKFVVGDYISCAILPPSPTTGEVAAESAARPGRGSGLGEARSSLGVAPPPSRRDNGPPVFGRGRGRSGGHGFRDRDRAGLGSGGSGFPVGEWRRGEPLPDPGLSPPRSRTRGRWD